MRRIHPLGMRVLVQIKKGDGKSDGGLYLPDNAKERGEESLLAEVVEVASAVDNDAGDLQEVNISGIPLGATVLIGKNAGVKVPWDEFLRVVETKDVLGIVDEMEII